LEASHLDFSSFTFLNRIPSQVSPLLRLVARGVGGRIWTELEPELELTWRRDSR
jgi:hypothetical protein